MITGVHMLVHADDAGTALTAKGARFAGDIETRAFGRTIALDVPGAGQMLPYEPRHPTAFDL